MIGGVATLRDLSDNKEFCTGLKLGVILYQQKIVVAHKRKEPLIIGDNLYYIQDGRERLQEMIEKICE